MMFFTRVMGSSHETNWDKVVWRPQYNGMAGMLEQLIVALRLSSIYLIFDEGSNPLEPLSLW